MIRFAWASIGYGGAQFSVEKRRISPGVLHLKMIGRVRATTFKPAEDDLFRFQRINSWGRPKFRIFRRRWFTGTARSPAVVGLGVSTFDITAISKGALIQDANGPNRSSRSSSRPSQSWKFQNPIFHLLFLGLICRPGSTMVWNGCFWSISIQSDLSWWIPLRSSHFRRIRTEVGLGLSFYHDCCSKARASLCNLAVRTHSTAANAHKKYYF